MSLWQKRFFKLNKETEVELKGHPIHHVEAVLRELGWGKLDSFWAPDLEVSNFARSESELYLVIETYFDPKLTGDVAHIEEVSRALESYETPTVFFAGGAS